MSSSDNNITYKKTSFLAGSNSEFINEFYADYISDPSSLPESWRKFFDGLSDDEKLIYEDIKGPSWSPEKKLGKLKILEKINNEEDSKNANINLNSIKDFEVKINQKIEFERFRGNIYIKGLKAWKERQWLGKTITINGTQFKVLRHIPRCSATNLRINSDEQDINLPLTLRRNYNHIDMGVYLLPLEDGEIFEGNEVFLS